jgi:hypothetical protein
MSTGSGAPVNEEAVGIVVIRAVVFDIAGVLEISVDRLWEARLGLSAGEI